VVVVVVVVAGAELTWGRRTPLWRGLECVLELPKPWHHLVRPENSLRHATPNTHSTAWIAQTI